MSGKSKFWVIVRAFWIVREVKSYASSKFQPPTTLGDHQNVEKTIEEKIDLLGFRKSVFRNFSWIWRKSTILSVKINFLVKFCSRYTYSEVRATKNCEKTICAARTWPPRALPTRAQIYIYGMSMVFVGGVRQRIIDDDHRRTSTIVHDRPRSSTIVDDRRSSGRKKEKIVNRSDVVNKHLAQQILDSNHHISKHLEIDGF